MPFGMERSTCCCPVLKCVRGKPFVKAQIILRKEESRGTCSLRRETKKYVSRQAFTITRVFLRRKGLLFFHAHIQRKPNPPPPPIQLRFRQNCRKRIYVSMLKLLAAKHLSFAKKKKNRSIFNF